MDNLKGTQAKRKRGIKVDVVVNLRAYLDRLSSEERQKPPSQQLPVPTIKELAEAVGVSRVTVQTMATGEIKRVNLETLSAIVTELRRRGFDPKESDLILIRQADEGEGEHD